MEDWIIGVLGCFGWNVLLWGLAHDESDKLNKPFNWKKYKRQSIDDAVVTLLVGVPLVVWKNEWLWEMIVNKLPLYFYQKWTPLLYDSIGLIFAGPIIQICYMLIKKMKRCFGKFTA